MKNVLKKLVKPATTILSKCKVYGNKLLKSDNFIGVPTFAIKQGLIQSLDKAYDKLVDKGYEVQTLASNKIIPFNFKTLTSKVETVEIRETLTKLSTEYGIVFIDTSYYMFFSSKIKNVEFYIYDSSTSTNPICLILNNEIVGIVMPTKCTDDAWHSNRTLEEYKKHLEIEELKEIKNNEFLQSLVNEYIDYHNKSLKEVPQHFESIIDYELEKVNKQSYQVVGITKDNQRQYYFKMTMLNCDVNLTEQKKLFKMIKEYLLTSTFELQQNNNKINDLSVEENKNNMEVEDMEKIIIKNDISDLLDITTVTENKTFEIKVYDNFVRCFMLSDDNKRVQLYNKDVKIDININTFKELVESNTIEYLNNINVEENKRYFKSTDPGHKNFIVIEGTKSIKKHLTGSTVWKIDKQKHIIKDYGHKDVNAYINHLKKFNYVEVFEDIKEGSEEVEKMEKYLLNKLDDNMYSYCYDIENVNNEIEKYNDTIKQINMCKDLDNMTEILENYINENKSKLVKKIKYIQHEDIMYNLTPLSSKKIENDNIKKSYFECKAGSFNELLNNFNVNGMSHNDYFLDGASFNNKSIVINNSATYTINELMIFTNNDYDLLINNLMDNIKVFENKGGSDILDDGSYLNHKCILCVNEDKTQAILIDPQFTNYANFSGLIDLPTALQYFNEEVVVVENITNKANDLIENIEIEKGLDANSYVKYCKENNIKTDDKNSINRKALQIHLLKYGKSSIWYKAAEKKNVKTKEDLIKVYFNELVNMLKSENIDLIKDNKITISSHEVEDLSMNLQLLANKDLVNTINDSFINNCNNVYNDVVEINSINDINNIDIKDHFSYMVFWTYTDTNERCKQGYKGKYIINKLNEFLECEFIDNIKICSHDYFFNNFNKIKDNTDLLN